MKSHGSDGELVTLVIEELPDLLGWDDIFFIWLKIDPKKEKVKGDTATNIWLTSHEYCNLV